MLEMKPSKILSIDIEIDKIIFERPGRSIDSRKVRQLAKSIRDQGLIYPIQVYCLDPPHLGKYGMAAGQHRREAFVLLGRKTIPAIVIGRTEAKAWAASENLHRTDLRVLDKSEAIVAYARARAKMPRGSKVRLKGGEQPHDKGITALSKEMGFGRTRISQAFNHAALPRAVKEKLRAEKIDNNRSLLNAIFNLPNEKAQLAAIASNGQLNGKSSAAPKKKLSTEERGKPTYDDLFSIWKKSSFRKELYAAKPSVRKRFIKKLAAVS